jgi:5-methylcytosine-specific restriction protein B
MNLSHVERYFADFLSVMESKDDIKLHGDEMRTAKDGTRIPPAIKFPKNLFVVGTMNVDETTHMFSPKVLDRAQVIEFRVSAEQMGAFLDSACDVDMSKIEGLGLRHAKGFRELKDGSCVLEKDDKEKVATAFKEFFPQLAELGFEFAFRTAREAMVFCAFAVKAGLGIDAAIDAAIMQKLLPKLHGSRRRLAQALEKFWEFCRKSGNTETIADLFKKGSTIKVVDVAKYPISAEKIRRMYKAVEANGFASYAEA